MAKRVTTIQPTLTRFTAVPITEQRRRKVVAYARVSTDHEEQQSSYEAQVDYYTNLHPGTMPDWEFAECVCRRRHYRHQHQAPRRLQADDRRRTGRQDRPHRNEVGQPLCPQHGGQPDHHPQAEGEGRRSVYFEKENIWTFDSKGELLITIMSSLAQEESRSIS